jgi:hypothetical protein
MNALQSSSSRASTLVRETTACRSAITSAGPTNLKFVGACAISSHLGRLTAAVIFLEWTGVHGLRARKLDWRSACCAVFRHERKPIACAFSCDRGYVAVMRVVSR